MNLAPFESALQALSPRSDRKVIRSYRHRSRLQTEETLRTGNKGDLSMVAWSPEPGTTTPHHIHTMSQENPFLPTDDEIWNGTLASTITHTAHTTADDVSSISHDSWKRYRNWHDWGPADQERWERPFVPPREVVVTLKRDVTDDAPVPDWLQMPLRNPSPRGPPPSAFSSSVGNGHPLLTPPDLSLSPLTTYTVLQPPPSLCSWKKDGPLRNMSWATETTTSLSIPHTSQQGSGSHNNHLTPTGPLPAQPSSPLPPPPLPPLDRPRRRHQRGSSQAFSIGSLVGQSSVTGHSSHVSAPMTTASASSPSLVSGDLAFDHSRRANRKLNELVATESFFGVRHHRSVHPLKGEVLHVLDRVSSPVKRLVKGHVRSKSYDLHASTSGCLA